MLLRVWKVLEQAFLTCIADVGQDRPLPYRQSWVLWWHLWLASTSCHPSQSFDDRKWLQTLPTNCPFTKVAVKLKCCGVSITISLVLGERGNLLTLWKFLIAQNV